MAKTKIFWIAKKVDDTMQMWAYNNKRKAQEKGLELFGVGMTDFSFKLDGEEFEDEDGFTAYISSGQIDSFGHFLLWREDGMPHAIGLEQERAATEYVEAELPSSAGACFPAKLKGGSCDVYMSSAVEANGALWTFEDGEIYENKTTMKYVPTFESFVNEFQKGKWVDKMDQIGKKLEKDYDKIEYDKYDVRITLPTKETGLSKYKDKEFEFYWDGNSARAKGDQGTYVQYLGWVIELDKWIDSFTNKKVWSSPAK